MHLYVILARIPGWGNRPLADIKAAVELLKEEHAAQTRGLAPFNLGLVYETPRRVPDEDLACLGAMEFI